MKRVILGFWRMKRVILGFWRMKRVILGFWRMKRVILGFSEMKRIILKREGGWSGRSRKGVSNGDERIGDEMRKIMI